MKHSDRVNKLESLAEGYLVLKHVSFYGLGKQLHRSRRRPQADLKNLKNIGSDAAHIAHLQRISLGPLDDSESCPPLVRLSLNQKSSGNIGNSMSKHKVLIIPTW